MPLTYLLTVATPRLLHFLNWRPGGDFVSGSAKEGWCHCFEPQRKWKGDDLGSFVCNISFICLFFWSR